MISVGGSTVFPDEGINIKFLSEFNKFIRKKLAQDKNLRFFIMVGGGHVGREYQYAARQIIGKVKDEDLDWLGIHGTRINAHLVRTILKDIAQKRIIDIYDEKHKLENKRVIVCSGWRPGWSTDYDMTLLAKEVEAKKAFCLCNVKMVYDRDPRLFPKAKPIPKMSWDEYLNMIGDWWVPTRQVPFDPFAAKLAKEIGFEVVILKGENIKNLEKAFQDQEFIGTTIK